jgi:predicted nuclease with RNAse H fold
MQTLIGIDYGAKMAGTTALVNLNITNNNVTISCSEKNNDADKFIQEHLHKIENALIFIDAPLSLPGVYKNLDGCNNYFYRKADQQLQAMSPMFLGGLTARAMQLNSESIHLFHEVYPAALAKQLQLHELHYKKEKTQIQHVVNCLLEKFDLETKHSFKTWHEVDALLALISGIRITSGIAQKYGDEIEGVIYV